MNCPFKTGCPYLFKTVIRKDITGKQIHTTVCKFHDPHALEIPYKMFNKLQKTWASVKAGWLLLISISVFLNNILCAHSCLFSAGGTVNTVDIINSVQLESAVYFWISRLFLSVVIIYLFQAGGMTFHCENLSVTCCRNDRNTKLEPLIQALYHVKNGGHTCHFFILMSSSMSLGFFALAEHITAISDKIQFLVIACRR